MDNPTQKPTELTPPKNLFYNVMPKLKKGLVFGLTNENETKPVPPPPEPKVPQPVPNIPKEPIPVSRPPAPPQAPKPVTKPPTIISSPPQTPVKVAPTDIAPLQTVLQTPSTEHITLPERPKSGRKLLTIILLLILVVAGYFGYRYYVSRKTPAVVVKNEDQATNNTKDTAPSPQAPGAVTTPASWQKQYFNNENCIQINTCGDKADPDRDGLTNLEEFQNNTDPNNPDSDKDGLADGDEVHSFGTNPLKTNTNNDTAYTDTDYIKGGYDTLTKAKFTISVLNDLREKIKQNGLHPPTLETLGDTALKIYGVVQDNTNTTAPVTGATGLDTSAAATLDRDIARANTIKKIGASLLKYKADQGTYPLTSDFSELITGLKPYNTVATNPVDPINTDPYVYGYTTDGKGSTFTLTYYSETQHLLIKYTATDAEKDANTDSATNADLTRMRDLDSLRSALLVYSAAMLDKNSTLQYVFPTPDKLATALVPQYISSIPKDPSTNKPYDYKVSDTLDSFTLKATLERPSTGTTGYLCNAEECRNY